MKKQSEEPRCKFEYTDEKGYFCSVSKLGAERIEAHENSLKNRKITYTKIYY